ncbi:MAG: calcium-binding protein, partial [Ilumatobacter sp.]|nr:calcium-binding protein [Ilumatobacter sp.]
SDGIFGAGLNVRFDNIESAELDTLEGNDTIYVLGTKAGLVTTVIGGLGDDRIDLVGDVLDPIVSDDGLGRSGIITHAAASTALDYDSVGVDGIGLNIVSPESLRVNLAPTGAPLLVSENGEQSSYFINLVDPDLTELATNPVYLTVSAGLASSQDRRQNGDSVRIRVNGGAFTNAVVLTFDGVTANTRYQIDVEAVNDTGEEGSRLVVISHSINSDAVYRVGEATGRYDDVPIINIFVDVRDNDKPGLDIRHIEDGDTGFGDNTTVVLEGAAGDGFDDTYSAALAAAPNEGETIRVHLDTDSQVTATSQATGESFLDFDTSNWKQTQLVTVQAARDGPDGTEFSTIVHRFSGGQAGSYGDITETEYETLEVTVYDEDTPTVIVEQDGGSTIVVENGATDLYRLRLTSQPEAEVTLTLRTDTQTKLEATGLTVVDETGDEFFDYSYTFTADNWNRWLVVTVVANADFDGESDPIKAFPPVTQNLDRIRGVLNVEGGIGPGEPRTLEDPVLLPGEISPPVIQNSPESEEADDIDTLNLFHSDNNDADVGDLSYRTSIVVDSQSVSIANPGLALTGFEMGGDLRTNQGTPRDPVIVYYGGGITWNGFEIVDVLLGKGDETLSITDTSDRDARDPAVTKDPNTITAIHGGGGDDTFTISGRGDGPLVIYGDTSEDRLRYSNAGPDASQHGTSFSNDGNDVIDARQMAEQSDGYVGLVAYGGFGNDTIWGSQDDDHLAGGTSRQGGRDVIDGQAGDDHIYGDSHFNVNLRIFAEDVQESESDNARVAQMFEVLDTTDGDDTDLGNASYRESAGADEITGGLGADIIFGDHGVITIKQGTRRLSTTSSVERMETTQPAFGGADTLRGYSADSAAPADDEAADRIFGGHSGDEIDAGHGNNVVVGDHGLIDLGDADSFIDLIQSTSTTSTGGADTISTGSDDDIVLGGRFGDRITIEDGDNLVLGDEGSIEYQSGGPLLLTISSVYLNDGGEFIQQSGDDIISVGASAESTGSGSDIVIAGLGNDAVMIGNGNNIALGDEGLVAFQSGSTLRDRIESRYLDDAGLSPIDASGIAVGNDTIETGTGDDVIIGGLGNETTLAAGEGNNIVLGDEGFVKYQGQAQTNGTSVLGEVSSRFVDNTAPSDPDPLTFVQGGNETITTGAGDDIVIGGLGHDDIKAGNGVNIVLGDEGGITFQTGSGLRLRIASQYLDGSGRSALTAGGASVGNDTIE